MYQEPIKFDRLLGVLYSVGKCDGDECSENRQVIAADKQQLPFFNFNIISTTVNKGEL